MTDRQVDIAGLSPGFAALVDALRPGEELSIVRGRVPVAVVSGVGGALEGEIVVPAGETVKPPASYDGVVVVATAGPSGACSTPGQRPT